MTDISEITRLLISNFNESIDNTESKDVVKYSENELKYLSLIVEMSGKCIEHVEEKFSEMLVYPLVEGINSINDMNFIDDILFAHKVVEYRKLEIERTIAILKKNLILFIYHLVYLSYMKRRGDEVSKDDIASLTLNKDEVRKVLSYWLENDNNVLIQRLHKYKSLASTLLSISGKK